MANAWRANRARLFRCISLIARTDLHVNKLLAMVFKIIAFLANFDGNFTHHARTLPRTARLSGMLRPAFGVLRVLEIDLSIH